MGARERGSQPAPARLVLPPHLRASDRSRDGLGLERLGVAERRRREDLPRALDPARRSPRPVDRPEGSEADHQRERRRRGRDVQRGRELVIGLQPADGRVLPRHHRHADALSDLRRATGQHHDDRPQPRAYDPNIVFAGNYQGILTRYDRRTGQARNIMVWPETSAGEGAGALKYRMQWTAPTVHSPHDPNVLYHTGNCVFRTLDEGNSWEKISPDLTRNDKSKLGPSGGPITKDNTGAEYYCTIFAFAESPVERGVLW